ncbi:MAG: GC-type dockerin domain-anchored protein [Phycisphaerales bacterium JB040]
MLRIVAAGTLAACAGASLSQVNARTGSMLGLWDEPNKWSLGVTPASGHLAVITDGSIVLLTTSTPALGSVNIGLATGTSGTLILPDNQGVTLNPGYLVVAQDGDGDLDMGPGNTIDADSVEMGVTFASDASAVVTGGQFYADTMILGLQGFAQYDMSAGTLEAGQLRLGTGASGQGYFFQTGGDVIAPTLITDEAGTGAYTITGGTADFGSVVIGAGPANGNQGSLGISGTGELAAATIQIGDTSGATLVQNSGTCTADTVLLTSFINAGGSGLLTLQGGVLDIGLLFPGQGTKSFQMIGGTLIVDQWGQPGNPFDLDPSGGLVLPNGKLIGVTTVYGAFELGANASVRYQLDTPDASDRIDVVGAVSLQGSLLTLVFSQPAPSDEFVLIDNDGSDPVTGTFLNLPEGATVNATVNGSPVSYTITYAGGDGNDVVLNAQDCPPDINSDGVLDNADLSDFVTLFLAGDLAADFTDDGFIDNGDISAFIAAFLAGCP